MNHNKATAVAAVVMLAVLAAGGGCLMSADVDAAGLGTQSDPYSGSASVSVSDGMEIWAYSGTYLQISFGRGADFEEVEGSGLTVSGKLLEGTVSAAGTYVIGFSPGGGFNESWPASFTLHVVSDVEELEFLSNPSDGVISYV